MASQRSRATIKIAAEGIIMKKKLQGMVDTGEPLMNQALEALREYHQALAAGRPPEEIRRLEEAAEWLFHAVSVYQIRALGGAADTLQ